MDAFIAEENLDATFAYLDNVTICGMNTEEHDYNLKQFLEAANILGSLERRQGTK